MKYFFIFLVSIFFLTSFETRAEDVESTTDTSSWFETTLKAAEDGDSGAQHLVGIMYSLGRGVSQDYEEALKWYYKSAEKGQPQAQRTLCAIYSAGQQGVSQDYEEALKWCRKAAVQGDAAAQYLLGLAYNTGSGVPQDFVEAYAWLNVAASQGYKASFPTRDDCGGLLDRASLVKAQERSRDYFEKYVEPYN